MRVFLLICFIILIGCENETKDVTAVKPVAEEEGQKVLVLKNDEKETFTVNGQEFQLTPWYGYYADYLKEDLSTAGNRSDNFTKFVGNPLSMEVLGYDYGFLNDIYLKPPYNSNKLRDYIVELDEAHQDIVEVVKEVLTDSTSLLSGGDYKVYFAPLNPDVDSEQIGGVTGFADRKSMVLMIDPYNFTEKSLKGLISHEYHHLVYFEISDHNNRTPHILEKVVMEGKADIFSTILYPDYDVPWVTPLDSKEKQAIWNYIDERRYSISGEDYENLLNGSKSHELPGWSNYKMGYQIMQEFLTDHPDMPIEEWTVMKAEEIIEASEWNKED